MTLFLSPEEMTPEIMARLEKKGLIHRLCPNHDEIDTPAGQTLGRQIYEPKEGYGPHKLITVTVNREAFAGFGTHPDNEEFLLIGDEDTNPLYLVICYLGKAELAEKIAEQTLGEKDFIALRVRYNDPQTSFFVMYANVPHGEAIVDHGKRPPSFYVTESRDLPLDLTDFRGGELKIRP